MDETKARQPLSGLSLAGLFLASLILGPACVVAGAMMGGVEYSGYLLFFFGPAGLVSGPLSLLISLGLTCRVRDAFLRGGLTLLICIVISLAAPAVFFGAGNWPRQAAHRATLRRAATDPSYLKDIINRYGVSLTESEATALFSAYHKRDGIPPDMIPVFLEKTIGKPSSPIEAIVRNQQLTAAQLWQVFRAYAKNEPGNRSIWEALVENEAAPEDLLVELAKVADSRVSERASSRLRELRARR